MLFHRFYSNLSRSIRFHFTTIKISIYHDQDFNLPAGGDISIYHGVRVETKLHYFEEHYGPQLSQLISVVGGKLKFHCSILVLLGN